MFFVALGVGLPLIFGDIPPPVTGILCGLAAAALITEAFRHGETETGEMLAAPTKSVALLLTGGGAIALLWTWPEPARHNAMLLLLSGACLLWGYRHDRARNAWLLAGPCLGVLFFITATDVSGLTGLSRFTGSAWLLNTALIPAVLVWSLIVSRRLWIALVWLAVGLLYLGICFLLAGWLALVAFALVTLLALVAVRQDPDVPFFPVGMGLALWLLLSMVALLPATSGLDWFPSSLKSWSAATLLSAQSGVEHLFGSYLWGQVWSIARGVPRTQLTGGSPWWQEYLIAQMASLGWLIGLLAVVFLVTLFLASTPSRRARDTSHPLLWRALAIVGWTVVGAPTSMWLVSPLFWLLVGGVLGLKEGKSESEPSGLQRTFSPSATLIPALMAALFVIPLVQSLREWRAERLVAQQNQVVTAASWAPWRADIVQKALTSELEQPSAKRNETATARFLAWLIRSNHADVAYSAEAQINATRGRPALASLAAAVHASPGDPQIRRRYADALKAEGRLEEARHQYEACANLSPLDPSLRIAIGAIWEILHNDELALAEYRKALALDPHSEVAQLKVSELSSRAVR